MELKTDGYFCDDLLVFNELGRGGYFAKGFAIVAPDIEHASTSALNILEDELRVLLRSIKGDMHLQFQWTVNSNYREELLGYYDATKDTADYETSATVRHQKFTDIWNELEADRLRRENLHLYVNFPTGRVSGRAGYKQAIDAAKATFDQIGNQLEQVFDRLGGTVNPMDDADHYLDYLCYFNPSRNDTDVNLDVLASIQENCFLHEAAPATGDGYAGFWLDGNFHGIIVLKSPPQATFSGMVRQLTSLPMLDYAITANVRPLDIAKEIRREERAIEKLQNALQHNPKERMRSTVEIKTQRIQRLMSDEIVPFQAQIIIRCWDPTRPGLQSKLAALESAITKLNGATFYSPAFPPTARNFYLATMPGWTRDRYDDFSLCLEDHNLANMLPVSSTPTGLLTNAEAIYPGANGNLVGIRTFVGQDASPQHAIVTGMTGAGKSMLLSDLLLQTEPYYEFTAIVDDGLSHARYIESISDQPSIIIRPEGNLTLNYLDTNGLPLSPQHLGDAAAMIAIMTEAEGQFAREQSAIVTEALLGIYKQQFRELVDSEASCLIDAAKCAIRIDRYTDENPDLTLSEAFSELFPAGILNSTTCSGLGAEITDDEASDYIDSHREDSNLFRLTFAFLERQQMPRHRQLVDWLSEQGAKKPHLTEKHSVLATSLKQWCADGSYGRLVDGVTNISLSGSHVHIELGKIPESSKELRALAAFLVTNHIRNEIMSRPRQRRKRVILEELGGFLTVPGGERIVSEFYQRMRKYNTWVVSVVQQTQMLEQSPVAAASLLNNSRIGIFLKQATEAEVDSLSSTFELPEATKHALRQFSEPTHAHGAPFIYYHKGTKQIIATARHVLPITPANASSPSTLDAK